MATNEETNAAGTDTRPPMLVENDYESWKIRIHRYIRGKPNGKLIWKSIQNGPTPHPMVTDPPPTNSTVMPAPRKKLDSEFNDEENKLEMADTQAEIILSQGLPRHIFNILNQTSTAKEIWDNVEMLMQGSGRTLQQRKEDLPLIRIVNEPDSEEGVRTKEESWTLSTLKIKSFMMEAKEKGVVLDADAEAFLVMIRRGMKGPMLLLLSWPNLSSNRGAPGEEHLDSDAETEIDDNTIPYHQYLLDTEAQNVPTEVSADASDKVSMIAILI
ncbi:hypothetical protein Tco_1394312 [Tanacetum coccineum]|uniref:DUF4219 domain-containing protein n=1 Tax=Tanacetum coccineum TaxID=301880 RepID=A0ABQ5CU38_9ASTR